MDAILKNIPNGWKIEKNSRWIEKEKIFLKDEK